MAITVKVWSICRNADSYVSAFIMDTAHNEVLNRKIQNKRRIIWTHVTNMYRFWNIVYIVQLLQRPQNLIMLNLNLEHFVLMVFQVFLVQQWFLSQICASHLFWFYLLAFSQNYDAEILSTVTHFTLENDALQL